MASRNLGTLTIDLIARTTGFVQGLSKAERESAKRANKIRKDLRQIGKDFGALAKTTAAAGVGAAAGLTVLINKNRALIDENAKLAKSLNTTFEGLAITQRAGDLSGVAIDKVAQATKDLTRRLSQAADGTGPAVEALSRLGLTAEQLQALPLDERIDKINSAIRDFIPAAQQAAVAGQLFGEEGSLAISRLDSDAIKTAREEAKLFGTTLSDIDARNVERANDAISTIGLGLQGFGTQLAADFSPLIEQIGKDFKAIAKEAGGVEKISTKAFNAIIEAAAFVADAVDGAARSFELLGKGAAAAFLAAEAGAAAATLNFDKALEKITAYAIALEDIEATANRPLAGNKFRKYAQDAQEAAETAARALEAADTGNGLTGGTGTPKITDKDIEALQDSFKTEQELLAENYARQQEIIKEGLARRKLDADEARLLELEAQAEFVDRQVEIEAEAAQRIQDEKDRRKQNLLADMSATASALGTISTLMNSESRKLFEIGKAAAIANAVVSTALGIVRAWEVPLFGPVLAPLVAAAGAAQIAVIKGQQFGGGGSAPTAGVTRTASLNAGAEAYNGLGNEPARNVFIRGINPGDLYSGQQIIELANEGLRAGATFVTGD